MKNFEGCGPIFFGMVREGMESTFHLICAFTQKKEKRKSRLKRLFISLQDLEVFKIV